MSRVEKDFSELDTDKVDFTTDWTWGSCGQPFKDGERFISHVAEDMTETRYKLPRCLNYMINLEKEWATKEAQDKMKMALGL